METKGNGKYQILLIDDDETSLKKLQEVVAEIGCGVLRATSPDEALKIVQEQRPDVVVADACIAEKIEIGLPAAIHRIYPNLPIIMMTGETSTQKAVQLLRAGAYDYVEKPFCVDKIRNLIKNTLHTIYLFEEVNYLRSRFNQTYSLDNILGKSPEMQLVIEKILKVAPINCNVLIRGENGTGKDLVANAIHNYSKVRDKRFLPINCSAIPAQLLESELFGHVKGAFTGAISDKIGLVQAADGGTLFLDEIGDMPIELQPKILRLLEAREIQKIGSNEAEHVNIRVISATNHDLKVKILDGSFREDLYYRLHTVEIILPPLRVRKSEIIPLAVHFLKHYNGIFDKSIKSISPNVLEIFQNYIWPGNVRELKTAIEHACVFCESEVIEAKDLPANIISMKPAIPHSCKLIERVAEFEKIYIETILKDNGHNMDTTSKQLGISPATIYRKLKNPAKPIIIEIAAEINKKAKQSMPLFD